MREWLLGLASSFWQWLNSLSHWLLGLASGFWRWLSDASQAQATFLGWVVGLVTLGAGALLNAHLNRRRDDRLRQGDRTALTAALAAELGEIRDRLQSNIDGLKQETGEKYSIRRMPQVRIFPDVISKLGLLDAVTIRKVIAAYNVAEGYERALRHVQPDEFEEVSIERSGFGTIMRLTEFAVNIQDTAIAALGGRPQD